MPTELVKAQDRLAQAKKALVDATGALDKKAAECDALQQAADQVWLGLGPDDWLEAFAAHPRIGERRAGAPGSAGAGPAEAPSAAGPAEQSLGPSAPAPGEEHDGPEPAAVGARHQPNG